MDDKKSAPADDKKSAPADARTDARTGAQTDARTGQAFERLVRIMARLRDPDGGCPWDVEQTFATIAPCTIEEAYEVADAVERNDLEALRDELGDLLLQVVFHARMAEEQNAFDAAAVCEAISDKMVRRHPHVFGDAETGILTAADQTDAWETQKAEERAARAAASGPAGALDGAAPAGALDEIAANLPALTRALKLQKRAARVGFDWPDTVSVRAKLDEELAELDVEIAAGPEAQDRAAEELGDVLFSLVNVARKLDLDADTALRAANAKFERRFRVMEAGLRAEGKAPETAPLAEMERHWQAAKKGEKT
ncbi:MAG: nucleoside triphosphate pyrophosphohydrolase [Rhodospirillales bacterium]